jgi:hypothetical protein
MSQTILKPGEKVFVIHRPINEGDARRSAWRFSLPTDACSLADHRRGRALVECRAWLR